MVVEELIAKLGLRVTGQSEARKFIKTLADVEKAAKSLGKGFKLNLAGNTSGLGRIAKDFERATAAARRFRLEVARANQASVRGGRGPGARGAGGLGGYGFNGYRPLGRGATRNTGANRRGGGIDPMLEAGLAGGGAGLGRATAAGAAAYAGGSAVVGSAKKAITWERALINLGKATDTSGKDLDAYAEKVKEISRATGKSKEDIAGIMTEASKSGTPNADLSRFTEYGAKAVTAWGMDADQTGTSLAQIRNIYKTDQPGIEKIGDQINTLADKTSSVESDLVEYLRRVGGSANRAGISSGTTLAIGASMKEIGTPTEVAASGFESFLLFLRTADEFSSKADEGLKMMGKKYKSLQKDFLAKPEETMLGFLDDAAKMSPEDRQSMLLKVFGKERQDDVGKLIDARANIRTNADLANDPKRSDGSVRGQFEEQMKYDVSQIDRGSQIIDQLYTSAGEWSKKVAALTMSATEGIYGALTKKTEAQNPNDLENRMRQANGLPALYHGDFEGRFGAAAPSSARASFRGAPVLTRQPKGMPSIGYPTAGGSTAPSFGAGTFGLNGAGGKGASWMNQGAKETVTNNTTNNNDVGNDKRTQSVSVNVQATGLAEVGALVKAQVQAGLTSMGPSIVKANSIPTAGGTAASSAP